MKSVGEMELMFLWNVVRGRSGLAGKYERRPLYQHGDGKGGVVVFRVMPAFISCLAGVPDDQIAQVAQDWHRCEEMAAWKRERVADVLGEMAEFARRAGHEGKPVLQRSAW
jgi:hypothetical protein